MIKKKCIRLVLADDHSSMRDGVGLFLAEENDMDVVGTVSGGEGAIRAVIENKPDILILDILMPRVNGLDVLRQLKRLALDTKVIAYSVYDQSEYVTRMVRLGAMGYITKGESPTELLNAIRAVYSGGTYFCSAAKQCILDDYVKNVDVLSDASSLSDREQEILSLIAEGLTNSEIGQRLGISRRTVETHRLHARRKLGLRTTADMIKYATTNMVAPDLKFSM